MDTQKFDAFTRSLATTGRRGVLKAVAGAALGTVGVAAVASDAAAQCVPRRATCVGRTPAQRDRNCCTGCCRGGRCRARRRCD